MRWRRRWAGVMAAILTLLAAAPAGAEPPAPAAFAYYGFEEVWRPVDRPVARGAVQRAWVWGPGPITPGLREPYRESSGGQRLVQYFDKGRLELNDPDDAVTAGLVARELVTGQVQVGDAAWEQRRPAAIPVAGDPDDADAPTYASLAALLDLPAGEAGAPITRTLARDGALGDSPALAGYGVTAGAPAPETGRRIADVFERHLASQGPIERGGGLAAGRLFEPWWRVTGLPLTEAVWIRARVGGEPRDVLVQLFERRALTYTPANDPAWRVEMGNIGRHAYAWRYAAEAPRPAEPPAETGRVTTGKVVIVAVDPAPRARAEAASVDLRNDDAGPVEMTGWRLRSGGGRVYAFPPFTLAPGASVRVWICRGRDDAANLYWGWCAPVWGLAADTATLTNQAGTVMHTYRYGPAASP